MNNQFSENMSRIMTFCKEEANRLRCKSIRSEHLLLGLLRDTDGRAAGILNSMSVDLAKLREEIESCFPLSGDDDTQSVSDVILDEDASKVLRFCILEARMLKSNLVDSEHLLLAILKEKNNNAATILAKNDVSYSDVREALQIKPDVRDGFGFTEEDDEEEDNPQSNGRGFSGSRQASSETTQQKRSSNDTPVLDNFGFDMTQAAKDGLLDPVVGRENEIERISQILSRRKKNNPVLIGEPGVGKSSVVEGLAQRLLTGDVPDVIDGKIIFSLDLAALMAGTKFRGSMEQKLKDAISAIQENDNIIACFSGHTHKDSLFKPLEKIGLDENILPCAQVVTKNSIPFPWDDNKGFFGISIDIIMYKPSERVIDIIRFGDGEDRKINI